MTLILLTLILLCIKTSTADLFISANEAQMTTDTLSLCHNSQEDVFFVQSQQFTQYRREWFGPAQEYVAKDLQKVYEYPLIVPSVAVQQGLSTLGKTARLERFMKKLLAGQPVKIAALGGSVTVGHGVIDKQSIYLNRFFNWINATFPHPDHKVTNHAIPGVTSAYVAPCVLSLLPPDPDLVLLEFTFNDGEKEPNNGVVNPIRIGLEHLVRKLLKMQNEPAVIAYHYHPMLRPPFDHYWAGSENTMEMIFKYYGIMSISFRTALFHVKDQDPELIKQIWRSDDTAHPSCIGHKFMSDLLIGAMQDFLAHLLTTVGKHSPNGISKIDQIPNALLSSTKPGDERADVCFLDEEFQKLLKNKQGYEWMDEVKKPGRKKYGFVSKDPGDAMSIQVPLEGVIKYLKSRTVLLALGALESYEHMGWLEISCSNGCTCPATQFDNHRVWPRYSLTYWKPLLAVIDEGSKTCELRIETMKKTSSGEYKIKLSSLLVSSEQEFIVWH